MCDADCGSGACLRAAADHGAVVSGIDASEALLAIARERVPEADLSLGDLQRLPYADDSVDAVTGFCSFFFADNMVEALRDALRRRLRGDRRRPAGRGPRGRARGARGLPHPTRGYRIENDWHFLIARAT